MNFFFDFIRENPDKDWDWSKISENPNITWDIIQKNPEYYWDYEYVCMNPSISGEIIENNLDLLNDWTSISFNTNIPYDFFKKHVDKSKKFAWECIANNSTVTWNTVQENPNNHWDSDGLSENPNMTEDILKSNFKIDSCFTPIKELVWNIHCKSKDQMFEPEFISIFKNPNISWETIKTQPLHLCYIDCFSGNPVIDIDIVLKNLHIKWNWEDLSANPSMTWEIIQKTKNIKGVRWDYWGISKNPNITISIIKSFPDRPWVWKNISENKFSRHPYYQSELYRKRHSKKRFDVYRYELIQKTCTPYRMFNWNEDMKEQFPNEHFQECEKWKNF